MPDHSTKLCADCLETSQDCTISVLMIDTTPATAFTLCDQCKKTTCVVYVQKPDTTHKE